MPNPLDGLDGQRKYVCTVGGENFYLRVVTSGKEIVKHQEASRALGPIIYQAKVAKQKELDQKGEGEHLKVPPKAPDPEFVDRWAREEYPKIFGHEDNQTVFILENEAGEFAVGMLMTINDRTKREALQVPPDVGTFIYVDDIVTAEKYRGCGLFSTAFDKVLTMMANPKREMPTPLEYSVSVTAVTAVRSDESEVQYVMNLPRYAEMWQTRFMHNQIQNRWQFREESGELTQFGLDRMPLENFLGEDGKLDEAKVSDLMDEQTLKAQAAKKEVRGLYLEGEGKDHDVMQEARKAALVKKAVHGFTREKTAERKGWHPDSAPAAVSGDPVVNKDKTLTGSK